MFRATGDGQVTLTRAGRFMPPDSGQSTNRSGQAERLFWLESRLKSPRPALFPVRLNKLDWPVWAA